MCALLSEAEEPAASLSNLGDSGPANPDDDAAELAAGLPSGWEI